MIAFNFQRLLEVAIVKILLFFEKQSMKLMIRKNLIAHRESNKLTAIIYSLTLGCIIFVVVAANIEFQQFTSGAGNTNTIDYTVIDFYGHNLVPTLVDPVL